VTSVMTQPAAANWSIACQFDTPKDDRKPQEGEVQSVFGPSNRVTGRRAVISSQGILHDLRHGHRGAVTRRRESVRIIAASTACASLSNIEEGVIHMKSLPTKGSKHSRVSANKHARDLAGDRLSAACRLDRKQLLLGAVSRRRECALTVPGPSTEFPTLRVFLYASWKVVSFFSFENDT